LTRRRDDRESSDEGGFTVDHQEVTVLHRQFRVVVVGVLLLSALVLGPGHAAAQRDHFQLKLGATYDQGDFGTSETTRTLYLPATFRYLGDWWDVGITGSFVYLDAPGQITLVDGAPTQTSSGAGGRESNAGIGDTILKARFFVVDDPGPNGWWPSLTPYVRLKIPTADEDKNLGTGEFDGGFGLEFDKTFGQFFVFGDVSYTFMGDPPGQDLRDRPGASIGAGYRLTGSLTVSAMLDWRRALVKGNDDPLELYGQLAIKVTPTLSLTPYVFAGLTDGSPDFGIGFEVSYRFGRW
jgi:Putative MetA-pathway of phenol degradation